MTDLSTGKSGKQSRGEDTTSRSPRDFHLHLVSDATGETLTTVAKAVAIQFDAAHPVQHTWPFIRTPAQLDKVLAAIEEKPGIVLFTMVDPGLRDSLQEKCRVIGVPCVSILDPVIAQFAQFLGVESSGQPGLQHEMDREYFARIDAMNFTLSHDDGQRTDDLHRADIVLVGVSRTSKTPTSIYLANRGLKVANIPLVPGVDPPETLIGLRGPLIVGLTANSQRLVQIRSNRLRFLNKAGESDYTDEETVKQEITRARRLFTQNDWPVIDVTRRSIEETAATVLNLYVEKSEKAAEK